MSVKAMSLVWDFPCPQVIGEHKFEAQHKFILIAYADHADHHGHNIYPSIETIRKKCGYRSPRTVQTITRHLETMGLLLVDGGGVGPRGTRKWRMPFNEEATALQPTPANIAGVQILQGANNDTPLGAIPSGAIPSGANIAPELKEPEPQYLSIDKSIEYWNRITAALKEDMPRASYETWVDPSIPAWFDTDRRILMVHAMNRYAADWMNARIKDKAQAISGVYVEFGIQSEAE
jgi:hypothetical protein